jgi:predicted small secreted protein
MMKTLLLFILGIASLSCFTACNTVRGVGEDVSVVGEKISSGAERVERRIDD